jgi:ABC-type branched-subunit amino acid transport system permease subunit
MINPYWELIILLCLINVIFTISLNLVLGYNGQFSLGHAGFLAIGAYASGVATATYGWPLWAGILLALVLTSISAVIIGYPCLRLRGDYLAIATLGFAEIIRIVLLALPKDIFGGPTGMRSVTKLQDYVPSVPALNGIGNLIATIVIALLFLGVSVWAIWAFVNWVQRIANQYLRWKYWRWTALGAILLLIGINARGILQSMLDKFQFSAAFSEQSQGRQQWMLFLVYGLVVAVTTWLVSNYLRSLPGRNVVAIRDDEIAASNLGLDIAWMKLQNFILSSALAGLAGALTAHSLELFRPASFGFFKSVEVLLMVVLGGMGSLTGSYVGALAITTLPELLRFLGEWRLVVYSLVLIFFMLFRPGGLVGSNEIGNLVNLKFFGRRLQRGGPDAAD